MCFFFFCIKLATIEGMNLSNVCFILSFGKQSIPIASRLLAALFGPAKFDDSLVPFQSILTRLELTPICRSN